jgi:hypothetical protein
MRITLPLLASICFFFLSCQKEGHLDTGSGGSSNGATAGQLLIKKVQKLGSDSLVTTYEYDGKKKLISLKQVGVDEQGAPVNREYHYHRNTSGVITDYSLIDDDLLAIGADSVTTTIHYNSSTSRYLSYVVKVIVAGYNLLDSSAFLYDGSGKIIREDIYASPSGLGNDYVLSGKVTYNYSANGNLTQMDIRDVNPLGPTVFSAVTKISYDTKSNPLYFGNEGLVMGHPEWASSNNIVMEQLSDSNGPSGDQTVTISYVYNSDGRPKSDITTVMPDNTTINTSFHYQ